ncbi:hypothetical protein MTR_5g046245 [Medicago truncatula]|uniref:Protein FAR1-RELATED SEQUENCE n=1 Tax=Medicago truncatula TaxID=3880 RepID=A0A072UDP3_MEDTR|nr:hypothetical protein MTR_5g046245 [Medicago truncatula]
MWVYMFMVSGYLSRQTNEWKLNILNGVHNHVMEPALEGHMLAGRLKEDDKKIVCDLTKSKVLPRNILLNLKSKRQDCMTNIKQVYNEHQQIWKSNRGDKTVVQFLISKLEEHNYLYFSITQNEILVMDSTYLTNNRNMRQRAQENVGVCSWVSGYLSRQTNEWNLNILNGVYNHVMEPALEGHMLAGRLKEDDKKIVHDLTKSKVHPRNMKFWHVRLKMFYTIFQHKLY